MNCTKIGVLLTLCLALTGCGNTEEDIISDNMAKLESSSGNYIESSISSNVTQNSNKSMMVLTAENLPSIVESMVLYKDLDILPLSDEYRTKLGSLGGVLGSVGTITDYTVEKTGFSENNEYFQHVTFKQNGQSIGYIVILIYNDTQITDSSARLLYRR